MQACLNWNFKEIFKKNPPENFIFPTQHFLAFIVISSSYQILRKKPVEQINKNSGLRKLKPLLLQTVKEEEIDPFAQFYQSTARQCDIKPEYFVLEIGFYKGHGLHEVLQLINGKLS